MTEYIYGYRTSDKRVMAHPDFTEQRMRSTADNPIRIPVSAIEPLPEPKPVLPTTPGSVVRATVEGRPAIAVHTANTGQWQATFTDKSLGTFVSAMTYDADLIDWSPFDAGTHEEGKTDA